MTKKYNIAVFNGDGIGPEVMAPTVAVLRALSDQHADFDFEFQNVDAGAAHYAKTGKSLPEESLQVARAADAILLSAMGLPDIRYPDGTEIAPQIELRMELDLYAGVRPVTVMSGQDSPLRDADLSKIDFVIVRESTEGLFASHGKGEVENDETARETMVITRDVSEKLFDFSFRLARQRRAAGTGKGKVTCVDKANVFKAFAFFRKISEEIGRKYPDIELDAAYVDATALWMVQKPHVFDVMVTENMFGDILSDLGAGIMGGLGLAPSADIGDKHAVFQPCHGSAPDIAGQGYANPIAMILSAAMMLDWLGYEREVPGMVTAANTIRCAVAHVIADGPKTRDMGGTASTGDISAAILSNCNQVRETA